MVSEKVGENLDRLVVYKCFPKKASSPDESNGVGNNEQKKRQLQEDLLRDAISGGSSSSVKEFEQLVDYSGECKKATELYAYCTDIIYTWGNGGKDAFLPKNVGIPFGEKDEYYLLESFLIPSQKNLSNTNDENSEIKEKRQAEEKSKSKEGEFDVDVDILLTESPRKYTAKILKVGYDPMSPLLVPPGANSFEVYGHCPNECTSEMIPKRKPFKAFGVSFDTGQTAKTKSVTLHHLRNAFEIPLILENKNYDPTYQEMQILRDETIVRPGDQLTVRCRFDTTKKPHALSSQPGAPQSQLRSPSLPKNSLSDMFSPRCVAYLWYYQDIAMQMNSTSPKPSSESTMLDCTTKIHPSDFAIWVEENAPREIKRNIDSPQLQEKLKKLKWSQFLLLSLSDLYEFGRYRASCGVPNASNQTPYSNGQAHASNRRLGSINRKYGHRPSNGTSVSISSPKGALASSPAGEITVHPVPVEDVPEPTGIGSGCPTFVGGGTRARGGSAAAASRRGQSGNGPFFGLPPNAGPVIFGFP